MTKVSMFIGVSLILGVAGLEGRANAFCSTSQSAGGYECSCGSAAWITTPAWCEFNPDNWPVDYEQETFEPCAEYCGPLFYASRLTAWSSCIDCSG